MIHQYAVWWYWGQTRSFLVQCYVYQKRTWLIAFRITTYNLNVASSVIDIYKTIHKKQHFVSFPVFGLHQNKTNSKMILYILKWLAKNSKTYMNHAEVSISRYLHLDKSTLQTNITLLKRYFLTSAMICLKRRLFHLHSHAMQWNISDYKSAEMKHCWFHYYGINH